MPPGSPGKYFIARLRGGDVAAVGSQPEGGPPIAVWNTYIWVESADEAAVEGARGRRARRDASPSTSPTRAGWRCCTDPEGAAFCVWQARQHKGAQIVNEPGSLNFNGLNTRDVDGAKSFYGSVFGWETLGLGGAGEMWRLPGYGEFLERSDPGLRERMAQSGAPDGFEDVVATLNPIAEDQPDVPAHWSVTFASRRCRRDRRDGRSSWAARWSSRRSMPRGSG